MYCHLLFVMALQMRTYNMHFETPKLSSKSRRIRIDISSSAPIEPGDSWN
jgi:hypothetical protein